MSTEQTEDVFNCFDIYFLTVFMIEKKLAARKWMISIFRIDDATNDAVGVVCCLWMRFNLFNNSLKDGRIDSDGRLIIYVFRISILVKLVDG